MSVIEEKALRYNSGKIDWTLLDYKSLESFAKVLMKGAEKYAPENWKRGMKLRDIRKSLARHTLPILNGDDIDPEWNLPHAAHAMCNLMFYLYYTQTEEGKSKVIPEDD